jgi:hypothetical protein
VQARPCIGLSVRAAWLLLLSCRCGSDMYGCNVLGCIAFASLLPVLSALLQVLYLVADVLRGGSLAHAGRHSPPRGPQSAVYGTRAVLPVVHQCIIAASSAFDPFHAVVLFAVLLDAAMSILWVHQPRYQPLKPLICGMHRTARSWLRSWPSQAPCLHTRCAQLGTCTGACIRSNVRLVAQSAHAAHAPSHGCCSATLSSPCLQLLASAAKARGADMPPVAHLPHHLECAV